MENTKKSAFSLAHKNNKSVPLKARRDRIVFQCESNLPENTRSILVGLSGGADSCALLGALCVLRDRGRIDNVVALHVCHNLRANCDKDFDVAKDLSARMGCKFIRKDIDPSILSGNVYDECRRIRYEMMHESAIDNGCSAVAVAHHLNDQMETVIFRMMRGSKASSLAGMKKRRKLGEGVDLIRPLLNSTRMDCERMCRSMDTVWIDDPSNCNTEKTRAFIRHKIVPLMRQLNPRIEYSIGRLVENLHQELKG